MKRTLVIPLGCLIGLLSLAACTMANKVATPTAILTAAATSVVANQSFATQVPPTPASPGQAIVHDNLEVTVDGAEFTSGYLTEYGTSREPPTDTKFLWVRVALKNLGRQAHTVPATEHFSVVYHASEFKPAYGHRQDHVDYTSLTSMLYQGSPQTAWLRFDLPATAELTALQFAYLPESSRVTFSPTNYVWANHPVYLWRLMP